MNFQKILLIVELNWMNDDAQNEINMFLRATEMNSTDMSLGGFFDVNRTLFKSVISEARRFIDCFIAYMLHFLVTRHHGYVFGSFVAVPN